MKPTIGSANTFIGAVGILSRVILRAGWAAIVFSATPHLLPAQNSSSAALTGQVSSLEEGAMEGVLVSAKRTGSTVTITVVSDAQGRYSFPRIRLEPGRYALRIRAVGYELQDPGPVEIAAQKPTQLDLKLGKARDLASQLTNAEWLLSIPNTDELTEAGIYRTCVMCHTLEPILKTRRSLDEWKQVLQRMSEYHVGSTPLRPQKQFSRDEEPGTEALIANRAAALSQMDPTTYSFQTLPRPKGKETRVIITEYDLPRRDTQPHDAAVDSEGMVWYADFGYQYIGRLDPKTAKVTEYPVPFLKPNFPQGMLDVSLDKAGDVWLGMMVQAGVAKFDRKTGKFQTWSLPKEVNNNRAQVSMVMPKYRHVDGKVWTNNAGMRGLHRLDLASGEIETINPYRDIPKDSPLASRPHSVYGIAADSKNNLYFMDWGGGEGEYIGRVDSKTRNVTFHRVPTFNSGPRRGHMDPQDRLWFAEFKANKIGMFDTKTGQFKEWPIPTPWANPYDAIVDKNEVVWAGGMATDRVVRLDTRSGESTQYLLPRTTNIRRVDVDNSTTPVTFWVGNNQGASILKLEPLE